MPLTPADRDTGGAVDAHAPDPAVVFSPGIHIPALDGIRGLAILLVLTYHFGYNLEDATRAIWKSGADILIFKMAAACWCGVDLFFVLSGFLITGILIDAKGTDRYLTKFYARRVLRIFPLYYGVLITVFLIAPLAGAPVPTGLRRVYDNQGWLWIYLSNIKIALEGKWFFASNWLSIGHFWSLAIEEQFYMIWPMLILFLSRRIMIAVCAGVILSGVALRTGLVYYRCNALVPYVLTPCRFDSLAVGGLLAIAVRETHDLGVFIPWARRTAAFCGLALVAAFAWRKDFYLGDRALQPVGYSLLAFFFGSLIILAITAPAASRTGRFWNNATLRFLGKYSYGLYVFHGLLDPLFERILDPIRFTDSSGSRLVGLAVGVFVPVALSVAVALLSWNIYEKPFLKLKRYCDYGRVRPRPSNVGSPVELRPGSHLAAQDLQSR